MAESGAHILSIDKYIDIKTAITTVDKVIMGNIPTALFLSNPEKVKEYTLEILSISKGYRHIVASGCEIPPYANPECIKEMVKVARSFNTMILRR
jgi:uroporphyrinogen-III decarboxylase